MFWLVCLIGLTFVITAILKEAIPEEFGNSSTFVLALKIALLFIGILVILAIIGVATLFNS